MTLATVNLPGDFGPRRCNHLTCWLTVAVEYGAIAKRIWCPHRED